MRSISELEQQWVAAERAGDASALERLLADNFRAVGPVGFVLDKQQWLDRYRNGDLHSDEIVWDDVDIRTHGDTAIAIGQWTERGAYEGHPVDGTFRVTQVLVRDDDDWSVSGVHLSPIGAPPRWTSSQGADKQT